MNSQQPLMMLLYRNTQRIKELKLLLSLVSSDEEKLRVQSLFDDFLKTEIPYPPFYNIIAYAGTRLSNLISTPQRVVSQKQEQDRSLTDCSACEDAGHSSSHGKGEGLVNSMSIKPSKKTRR